MELGKIGDFLNKEYIVTYEDTADFLGNKGIVMLSTPAMIKYMEITAAEIVFSKLPENYRVVGTKIDINHINPTPLNQKIVVKATISYIDDKKICYLVEAYNEKTKIGFGTYEQRIINLANFLDKNKA